MKQVSLTVVAGTDSDHNRCQRKWNRIVKKIQGTETRDRIMKRGLTAQKQRSGTEVGIQGWHVRDRDPAQKLEDRAGMSYLEKKE